MSRPAGHDVRRFAAVDCGTNSTRLLVVDDGGRQLLRLMRITRLGQGVDATRRLDSAAIARTLAVLAEFRTRMDELGVGAARMAATSAVRDAANARDFLDPAAETVGVVPEILSGEAEGHLAYEGATAGLLPGTASNLVVDIGGGSTELVLGAGPRVLGAVSLDVGCVRLTERFFGHDPPRAGELSAAEAGIGAELAHAEGAVPLLTELAPGSRLIGLAGTVATIAMLEQGLAEYDWEKVHHFALRSGTVERWCATLAGEPAADRLRRPGMVDGRQDVIVGGVLVLREVMRRWRFEDCLVSETDILDGLAASVRADR